MVWRDVAERRAFTGACEGLAPLLTRSRGLCSLVGVTAITLAHWLSAFAAHATWPPLPADHVLDLCKSPLATDLIIATICLTGASECGYSGLDRQPYVNKHFLSRRN